MRQNNDKKKKVKVKSLSRVRLFAILWTVAHQALPSMGFSRQEYWSGLPFPSPGDLPNLGIEPRSPVLEVDALTSEPLRKLPKRLHQLIFCGCAKSLQLCPTVGDPMDCSPPGSSIQGFSRQEYWSGLPFPSPGDLPDPGIEPRSPTLQADSLTSAPPGKLFKS